MNEWIDDVTPFSVSRKEWNTFGDKEKRFAITAMGTIYKDTVNEFIENCPYPRPDVMDSIMHSFARIESNMLFAMRKDNWEIAFNAMWELRQRIVIIKAFSRLVGGQ